MVGYIILGILAAIVLLPVAFFVTALFIYLFVYCIAAVVVVFLYISMGILGTVIVIITIPYTIATVLLGRHKGLKRCQKQYKSQK